MCMFGRGAASPNFRRAPSTRSSAAISCTFFFTGTRPTRSFSRASNTSSMPAAPRSVAKVTVVSAGSSLTCWSRLRGREARRGTPTACPLFLCPVCAVAWAAFPVEKTPKIARTKRPRNKAPLTAVMMVLPALTAKLAGYWVYGRQRSSRHHADRPIAPLPRIDRAGNAELRQQRRHGVPLRLSAPA